MLLFFSKTLQGYVISAKIKIFPPFGTELNFIVHFRGFLKHDGTSIIRENPLL